MRNQRFGFASYASLAKAVILGLVSLFASGCLAGSEEEEEVASVSLPVSLGMVTLSETSTAGWANIVTAASTSLLGQSMGVIRTSTGSCGTTFISNHYAITAAHCVEEFDINALIVFVESYRTSSLQLAEVWDAAVVSGTPHDTSTWTINDRLTSSEGYNRGLMLCRVKRRCDGTNEGCPSGVPTAADIALLECPLRTSTSWIPVESSNPTSGDVETWWFHEVLALQQYAAQSGWSTPADNYADYGLWGGLGPTSWHYTAGQFYHQVLPLRSLTWADGTKYKITGSKQGFPHELFTDTPVCHGTSGSGMLLWGHTAVLGPTVSSGELGSRLCHYPGEMLPGNKYSSFIKPAYTRKFELPEVLNDR